MQYVGARPVSPFVGLQPHTSDHTHVRMKISNLVDPEPCDDCDTGICYIWSYDDVRRCKNCVHVYATKMGWYDPPEPPAPALVPAPDPGPPPLPPRKMSRKAIQAEKELRAAQDPQGRMVL